MSVESMLLYLLCGLIVGAVARFLMPGPNPMAWWQTILLGIAGSVIGGWLSTFVNLGLTGAVLGVPVAGLVFGVLGAVLILAVLRVIR